MKNDLVLPVRKTARLGCLAALVLITLIGNINSTGNALPQAAPVLPQLPAAGSLASLLSQCTTGKCCDNGRFRPSNYRCSEEPYNIKASCSTGQTCGARGFIQNQYRYCTGTSADCGTSNLMWGNWETVAYCSINPAVCQTDELYAWCSPCPFGCTSGGGCDPDQCANLTCQTPPANTCQDSNTLRLYKSPGSCSFGSCAYSSQLITCQGGCALGSCLPGLSGSPGWKGPASLNLTVSASQDGRVFDPNHDGYADLIARDSSTGKNYLFYGGTSGLGTSPGWITAGGTAASAGDVNKDGFDDLIVIRQNWTDLLLLVYYGSAGGLPASSSENGVPLALDSDAGWAYPLPGMGFTNFANPVTSVGDVNKDGYSDVLVGLANQNVYAFYGSAAGFGSAPGWMVNGGGKNTGFGMNIAAAGDVNGDQYADVIIGGRYAGPTFSEGAAYVFHGSPGGLTHSGHTAQGVASATLADADWVYTGQRANMGFGGAANSAGDVNNDGFDDVIIGLDGLNASGGAFVFHGSPTGLSPAPAWSASNPIQSITSLSTFGAAVSSAGDVNGDGFDDVLVGAWNQSDGYDRQFTGRVYLYLGSSQGLASTYNFYWTGLPNFKLGKIVFPAYDLLNHDGRPEVAAASASILFIYGSAPNHLPQITSTQPDVTVLLGQTFTYQVQAADPDPNDRLWYSLTSYPKGMTINQSGLVTWTFNDNSEMGLLQVKIRVTDLSGWYIEQSFSVKFKIPGDLPQINPIPDQPAAINEFFSAQVYADSKNFSKSELVYSLVQAPSGMWISAKSGKIGWTPQPSQSGSHPVTVRVSDPDGLSATADFQVLVSHAPEITSSPILIITKYLASYTYQITVRDDDPGDSLTYALLYGPEGMSIQAATGLLRWTPTPAQAGSQFIIAVQVSDSKGNTDQQSFMLTVQKNTPPQIISTALHFATEGKPYLYPVRAIDDDSPQAGWGPPPPAAPAGSRFSYLPLVVMGARSVQPLSFRLLSGPAGLAIDPLTGLVKWTPTAAQVGDASVSLAVKDWEGLETSQTFSISVTAVANSDQDRDGHSAAQGDCDDLNPLVHPGAVDIHGNGIDENCDGIDTPLLGPGLFPPASIPDAIAISTPTEVIFTTLMAGAVQAPQRVYLQELDWQGLPLATLGDLVDDGSTGDLKANDFVYSGKFTLESAQEGYRTFRTVAIIPDEVTPVTSAAFNLAVTRFPTSIVVADKSKAVVDSVTGLKMLPRRLIISFYNISPVSIQSLVEQAGGHIIGSCFTLGFFQVEFPDAYSSLAVRAKQSFFKNQPGAVRWVEPEFLMSGNGIVPTEKLTGFYDEQLAWPFQDIRADQAWIVARGGKTIAIVDTGVDWLHPDLYNKVDFLLNSKPPFEPYTIEDEYGHGTIVAGIAGAESNSDKTGRDSTGMVGMAWNSKIMPVRVLDEGGWCESSVCAKGIVYAAARGAKIINVSFSPSVEQKLNPLYWEEIKSFYNAVAYATGEQGALVVTSAGNENCALPNPWAIMPNVLSVGAVKGTLIPGNVTRWIEKSTECENGAGSNYGPWVKIAAPGYNILSTLPTERCPQSMECYEYKNTGTSFAAPLVSGAAALVWEMNPRMTAFQVAKRLIETAKPLPGEFNPDDPEHGAGLLDVYEAVFMGSFEIGDLTSIGWERACDAYDKTLPCTFQGNTSKGAGMIFPTDGEWMAFNKSGPDTLYEVIARPIEIREVVQTLTIDFDYNYLMFDKDVEGVSYTQIWLDPPNGTNPAQCSLDLWPYNIFKDGGGTLIDAETVLGIPVLAYYGGNGVWSMTGWSHFSCTIDVNAYGGPGLYSLIILSVDAWQGEFGQGNPTVIFIDNLQLK